MMKYITYVLTFLFCALRTYAASVDTAIIGEPFVTTMVPQGAYVFYVIGDWGRKGKHGQKEVAEGMNTCATIVKPNMIVSTGDNFYTFGVKSSKDRLWKQSYENIYDGKAIKDVDWYPVLGNHDHYGNEEAEIAYSKINPHWKMPSDYYATDIALPDSNSITFVFTNTEPLVHKKPVDAEQQWKFIDSTLAASTAKWKFAAGHHPVYSSNPTHGDSPELIAKLKPILEKYHAQAYFCGHDHDLQHQRPKGSTVDYFVSGAGSELRPTAAYEHTLFALSRNGFMLVAIKDNNMYVFCIDKDANVVYRYSRER
jgi:tartrate-resistant acid phosphatase type 5